MNHIKLTSDRLDLNEINDLAVDESCGAVSMFLGTTRDNFEDKKVVNLEYEAYETMAVKAIESICTEMRLKWLDLKHIVIYHRLGVVPVKEASVIIAVSSPHRKSSLDATQYAIDSLKKNVPIWKKEQYEEVLKRKSKLPPLNFDECSIDGEIAVPKNLIQIRADSDEMMRRVSCFVERKREEIDLNNIQDFIDRKPDAPEGCARTNSAVVRKKDSKGHLRVHRVKNEHGPQTQQTNYKNALDKLMDQKPLKVPKLESFPVPDGAKERLENAEKFLGINEADSRLHIYDRLKKVEDRILYLETVSPEYRKFAARDAPQVEATVKHVKPSFSIREIDKMISGLKKS